VEYLTFWNRAAGYWFNQKMLRSLRERCTGYLPTDQ
jgi:hypothetical protein